MPRSPRPLPWRLDRRTPEQSGRPITLSSRRPEDLASGQLLPGFHLAARPPSRQDRAGVSEDREEEDQEDEPEEDAKHRPWLWAGTSGLCLLVGVWLITLAPDAHRDADRYRAALECTEDATSPPSCIERVPGEIERTRRSRGRREDDFYVYIRVGDTATFRPKRQPVQVEIEAAGDWRRLRQGQHVELFMWGDDISRIAPPDNQPPIETNDSPLYEEAATFTFAPLVVGWSLFGLLTAFRLRRRSGSWWRKAPMYRARRTRPWGCGLVLGSLLAVMVLAVGMFDLFAVGMFGVIGLVVGSLLGLLLRWWQGRREG